MTLSQNAGIDLTPQNGHESEEPDEEESQQKPIEIDDIIEKAPVVAKALKEVKGHSSLSTVVKEEDNGTRRFLGKHRHYFSGERLWSDKNCCICRQEASSHSSLRDMEKLSLIENKIFNNIFRNKAPKVCMTYRMMSIQYNNGFGFRFREL